MSFSCVLRQSETATGIGYTKEQPDVANSTSALFMIDVTALSPKAALKLTMQCKDAASGKWFDVCAVKPITAVGQYTYPEIGDTGFFQTIPGIFRFKYELPNTAIATFSIGFNSVS